MLVGATKCATTWLSEALRHHPELHHSTEKSPDFFSTDAYRDGWERYQRAWGEGTGMRGESSTSYMYRDRALTRIRRWFPEVRLLLVLRNPRDRAISHVRHKLRTDRPEDLDAYLAKRSHLITDSLYAEPLRAIYARFPEESVRMFFFEEIQERPARVIREAYDHVGVDPEYRPSSTDRVIGEGFAPRFRGLERVKECIAETLRNAGRSEVVRMLKATGVGILYRYFNARSQLSAEVEAQIRDALRPYLDLWIDDLERLRVMEEIEASDQIADWLEDLRNLREFGEARFTDDAGQRRDS